MLKTILAREDPENHAKSKAQSCTSTTYLHGIFLHPCSKPTVKMYLPVSASSAKLVALA